jgi:protein-tyrosine phosphatase
MSWDNIEDARAHKRRYTLNETEYLLIELPDIGIPNRIDELLYEMRLGDLTPILTHPERNMTLQRDPNRLRAWVDAGLLVQVTAGSVTGGFGATAETVAWSYLNHNLVHFIATDAHNLEKRPPTMRAAHHLIGEILGHDTADRLCIANPLAVFEGRPMPPQPATHQAFLGEDEEEDKRPFWKRLLNRT